MKAEPVLPFYKRKLFWAGVVGAAGVALDLTVGEQSTILNFVMMLFGGA